MCLHEMQEAMIKHYQILMFCGAQDENKLNDFLHDYPVLAQFWKIKKNMLLKLVICDV